jgi:hypothetical protein
VILITAARASLRSAVSRGASTALRLPHTVRWSAVMSLTGLDLRRRLRRRVVVLLDRLLDRLERDEGVPAEPAPPPPSPSPPPLRPLPEPAPRTPLGTQRPAATATAEPTARGETDAARKAKASPEDRQKAHWERTRRGILRFVADQGGRSALRELHDYSERTFFVAHVGFSRLMEELTGAGLLDYDHDTAIATITEAGRVEAGEH